MPTMPDGAELGIRQALGESPDADSMTACVHCGFCVPACPTWDLLGDENDSPRGRLYLMRAEGEGRVSPDGAFAVHLQRCLGCRACESVCPAGVPYGHLLERARARIPRDALSARVERTTVELLTGGMSRDWTPTVYALGRLVRGIAGPLGRLVPGRAGRSLRLLAATRRRIPRVETGWEGDSGAASQSSASGRTYSLLSGCVMSGLFGHVQSATRRVLGRWGWREVRAPGQVCCGALHAHAGLLAEAAHLARQNIEAFEKAGDGPIITDSAGCGAALRDYADWLEGDPAWRERARVVAERARDVTEVLADTLSRPEVSVPIGRLHGRAAYDAPCHLLHAQGVRDAPLTVLGSIDGLQVEELPSADRCCGGAGLYNLAQPELAERVRAPKVEEIRRGAYDWVATGNPGCIMYLADGLRRAGDRTPVVHPVELVDLALRSAPETEARVETA